MKNEISISERREWFTRISIALLVISFTVALLVAHNNVGETEWQNTKIIEAKIEGHTALSRGNR